eukprot:3893388-Pleurochrysis_carterae.AAC.1
MRLLPDDESSRASIAASSKSTSSQGWNGWSGSEHLPTRLVPKAPMPAPLWFMTPDAGEAFGASGATGARGNSSVAALYTRDSERGSVSADRMHKAWPWASRVNATSPPPCANSALSAVSASDFESGSGSVVTRAARESLLRGLCFASGLSRLALRFVQPMCQCGPLHHLHGAHSLLHFSSGSGRGRFGSAGLACSSLMRTAKA